MGPSKALFLAVALALPLAAFAAEEPTITLRWALGAIETGSDEPTAIQKDTQLQSGDRLKFLLEPMSVGSVYLILLDSSDDIHVLHREAVKAASDGKPRYIPPGKQWFEVDKTQGLETFFLLAAAEPLSELESLLDRHGAAEGDAKKQIAREAVAEIRRQHKAHRQFARPIEKPMMIGGQTRGGPAVSIDRLALEVTAERFYAKTITIEH